MVSNSIHIGPIIKYTKSGEGGQLAKPIWVCSMCVPAPNILAARATEPSTPAYT